MILCSTQIFQHLIKLKFTHYDHFKIKQIGLHSKIISENEEPTHVFFLKQGEYQISLNKSLIEISEIIHKLGGKDWTVEKKNLERMLSNNSKQK